MKSKSALCLAALLALCAPAQSRQPAYLDGQLAHDRITSMTSELHWNESLGQVEQSAREQGKMVFWVH
ncbi:MAG: hypothetical protein HYX67_01745, partial [Candidatus Melainabacteria bacterium]|nr:hypothetical protein [Candidatus Melainabacteria bacterium]